MLAPMRVAVAQIEPTLGDKRRNLDTILARLEEAAAQGAALVVFPECALTGYLFESADEARPHAEELPGPATDAVAAACARLDVHCVFGLLQRAGDDLHNAAALVGPAGLVGSYRKTHLPFLGVDRFVVAGADADVFDTPIGRIGIEICYDLRFPELTRTLALRGAEIVAHPTNWPVEARLNAELYTRARAAENRIFLLTANRYDRERWAEFCGWSQICGPSGDRLAEAGAKGDALLVAEIDVGEARAKDLIPKEGEYEMRLWDHRRPDLYGALVEETTFVTT
jgi:predicted amidohydrolase